MAVILIADDDRKIVDMLRRTLSYEGFDVESALDGIEALAKARLHRPDLIVLDWLMPGRDGLSVMRELRAESNIPILMLTARDAVEDRVLGLDSGADDYLVKPFEPAEFLARVRVLLRRVQPAAGARPLTFADLTLNPSSHETRRGNRRFELTRTEFELLSILIHSPRQIVTRERLLEDVWGYDFGGNGNILDVYIGYLRAKTEAGGEPRLIHTVRGVGYMLRENE